MRGMINGEWHAEITSAGGDLSGMAEGFSTPASKHTIDHARLRERPQSYHLYDAHACPFAHRTLLARAVSGLNLPTTNLMWRDPPELQEHLMRVKNIPNVSQTVRLGEYRIHYFDDSAFTIRKPMPNGRWIVPRTFSMEVSH